ncbi:MAG: hypothetical protein EDM05_017750 [Leptolyngbya sp. IPPAS B-1204]|uniref:Uncharacterized protein n=1 Tax=Leptolyngbya sp. NK1-12 TaxID=2547451 RepID=A0AA97APT6_9CYAN|nr:hypothetical protein [Leptolyngbya sp. NK1-12]MBF2045918.1 hypothetical protein [Elainella sp. C42_A2020_010]RNJ69757.1 MAG: hypothetical protein EDM05_07765 [Leptolyngbya sp. IPPAS B-1204]WNZ22218.1 hypothetical protein HJG54_04625 [Leptolyngbya sp. NK1-12]
MTIDEQIQQLIEQAPLYGAKTDEIQLIAPVFKAVANQLQYSQYYILQNLEQNWVMTTLKHRTQPNVTKNVVYAYPSLNAVKTSVATEDPQIMALPVPVIQILFQLLAMEPVDSVIFFGPVVDQTGTEVSRQGLRQSIEQYVQSLRGRSSLPPDIA